MRYNLFLLIFLAAFAFFQYRLWFEAGGIRDLHQLKTKLSQRLEENEQLKLQNKQLLAQIESLRTSKDATEARARELGMIKKDEIFYQIVKTDKS